MPEKGKKVPQVLAAAGVSDAVDGGVATSDVNKTILTEFFDAAKTVKNSPVFKDITTSDPVGLNEKGRSAIQAPFDPKVCASTMKLEKNYMCGGNFFWIGLEGLSSLGVPINPSAIDKLQKKYFSRPGVYPDTVVIAIPDMAFEPLAHRAALQCISPDEMKIAFVMALAKRINDGADAEKLKAWKHMGLTVSMHFKILPSQDEVYFAVLNMRQEVVVKFETLARAAYQWIFEIVAFRQRMIKELGGKDNGEKEKSISPKVVTDLFNKYAESDEGLKSAQSNEQVNEEFVRSAIAVYERILRISQAAATVLWFEHTYGMSSPLDSVFKLHRIAKRIRTDDVPWVFAQMRDMLESKRMGPKDFPDTALAGTAAGGGRGLVDLYVLKNDMRVFLIGSEGQRLGVATSSLTEMQRLFSTFEIYREKVQPFTGETGSLDRSYQTGWSKSSLRFMGFVEEVVFGEAYDGYLKTGCRASKSPADILEYPTLDAQMDSIVAMVAQEKEAAQKEHADSLHVAGGPGGGATSIGDEQPQTGQGESDREITRLAVEPESQAELKRALQSSTAGKMLGTAHKNYVVVVFDVMFCGESDTKPRVRIPPWPASRAEKLVQAALESRSLLAGYTSTQLAPGDFFLICDGGEHGNSHNIKNLFKDENGANYKRRSACVKVIKSETGITDRYSGARRGWGSIAQDEYFYVIALDKMKLPVLKRKRFAGTNKGNAIADVPVLAADACWTLPRSKKFEVIDKCVIRVGGKEEDDDSSSSDEPVEESPAEKKRKVDPNFPTTVFHPEMPPTLVDEFVHPCNVKGVIDLAMGPGTWAKVAVERSIPYFGVALSSFHKTSIFSHLEDHTRSLAQNEASFLHLGCRNPAAKAKPEPKPKPKAKPKAKAEASAHSPAASSGSGSDHE
ncbi:unnamed protein product [Prorocentrum cordatum]|uniref:Uncharacterized protein n=1 Tax=Prorocentrum cordatum TaxID=2364126 RepID=A0ABN9S1Y1_9DINO|nr:unnamed protein product [Polarella glacialis]